MCDCVRSVIQNKGIVKEDKNMSTNKKVPSTWKTRCLCMWETLFSYSSGPNGFIMKSQCIKQNWHKKPLNSYVFKPPTDHVDIHLYCDVK